MRLHDRSITDAGSDYFLLVFAGAAALSEAKVLVEAVVLAEAEVLVEGVVELGGRGDAGEDLLDLFVQVGVLEGGALGLQYGRGHPNNLSVLIELDIGGVADDAGLDALAKPVLVDEDTAEVGAGLYIGVALVDGTVHGGDHFGILEVGLDLAVFVDEGGDPFRLTFKIFSEG